MLAQSQPAHAAHLQEELCAVNHFRDSDRQHLATTRDGPCPCCCCLIVILTLNNVILRAPVFPHLHRTAGAHQQRNATDK